ncbi:hypothetical protein CYMTET_35330 [Cymbomonas tetramitiformis]|uniref:Uncharacterized protein n=1 Tax=Cymbomonas tetramitiformis TaxID=36881 RepID=A0AAE0F9H8_9CHLO|nr:hypothetical protein CYMTET_35330 [Cymbomonas tetramitiformis]
MAWNGTRRGRGRLRECCHGGVLQIRSLRPEWPVVSTGHWTMRKGRWTMWSGMDPGSQLLAQARAFFARAKEVPLDTPTRPGPGNGLYSPHHRVIIEILCHVVDARLWLLTRDELSAEEGLRKAVALEDSLPYMEPPFMHQPVRQCLGLVLLAAGRLADAERVYLEDLDEHPNNGWSLIGLLQIQQRRQSLHTSEEVLKDLRQFDRVFDQAWSHGDLRLTSSCPSFDKSEY